MEIINDVGNVNLMHIWVIDNKINSLGCLETILNECVSEFVGNRVIRIMQIV